jgi:uncharacterized membrane protein (DUF373 family)
MERTSRWTKIISAVELVIVTALQALVILLVIVATVVLFVLFTNNLLTEAHRIESIPSLLEAMQTSFAGILIVVLGLELLDTLKAYFVEHHIRLEVILVVAIIAVGRHVIQVDFEHTPGTVLIGLSSVILALTLGYYLVKKT